MSDWENRESLFSQPLSLSRFKPDTSWIQIWLLNDVRGCIQKFPDWVDNEINNNNKHLLRINAKGYGGKIHWIDSQNSDTTAPSGRALYHLQFSL
jgi:hypothetical protein